MFESIMVIASALLAAMVLVNQRWQKFSRVKLFLREALYNAPARLDISPKIHALAKIKELLLKEFYLREIWIKSLTA
jgi:hypothetical protein